MAVYTRLSNEEIAHLVREVYGLGELAFAVGIAQGVENSNYLVTVRTPEGAETRYVLTLFEKRVNAQELPFFMSLMVHLANQGITCPKPIAMRDGSVTGMLKNKHFVLASFLDGKSVSDIRVNHCAQVGALVANLHHATEGFGFNRHNNVGYESWKNIAHPLGEKLNNLEENLHELVMHELAFLQRNWPKNLPSAVVHSDIFPDNVFFDDEGKCCGVIDFYFACTDMLAYDLAIAMNAWCFDTVNHTFDEKKSAALLAAYQTKRELRDDEKVALPVLARGAALRFLLTRAYDALHAPEGAIHTVKDPLEYSEKLRFHQRVTSSSEYGC